MPIGDDQIELPTEDSNLEHPGPKPGATSNCASRQCLSRLSARCSGVFPATGGASASGSRPCTTARERAAGSATPRISAAPLGPGKPALHPAAHRGLEPRRSRVRTGRVYLFRQWALLMLVVRAPGGIRTPNQPVRNRPRYPLRHRGIRVELVWCNPAGIVPIRREGQRVTARRRVATPPRCLSHPKETSPPPVSNRPPAVYKTAALPDELGGHEWRGGGGGTRTHGLWDMNPASYRLLYSATTVALRWPRWRTTRRRSG